MQRRDFLAVGGALAAGSVFAASTSAEPPKRLSVVILPTDNGNVAKITGPPAKVREFVEDYQTYLWPDWRTHRLDDARKQMERLKTDHDKGHGLVSVNWRRFHDALLLTAAKHAVPIGAIA